MAAQLQVKELVDAGAFTEALNSERLQGDAAPCLPSVGAKALARSTCLLSFTGEVGASALWCEGRLAFSCAMCVILPLAACALNQYPCAVIELHTAWAGPTAAAKTAWRKLAVDMGGGPLPFDLCTLCLDHMLGGPGVELLAGFPLTSEPQWVLFKHGKQVNWIDAWHARCHPAALA